MNCVEMCVFSALECVCLCEGDAGPAVKCSWYIMDYWLLRERTSPQGSSQLAPLLPNTE